MRMMDTTHEVSQSVKELVQLTIDWLGYKRPFDMETSS